MEDIELFDEKGHLTDDALYYLINGEPNELQRLEISEHLSFCDDCLIRYTALVSQAAEDSFMPNNNILPTVMKEVKQRSFKESLNRFALVGMAACIALVFWFAGVFNINTEKSDKSAFVLSDKISQISEQTTSFTNSVSEKINEFFNNINERES